MRNERFSLIHLKKKSKLKKIWERIKRVFNL